MIERVDLRTGSKRLAILLCVSILFPASVFFEGAFAQTGVTAGGVSTDDGWHVLLSMPEEFDGQPVVGIEFVSAGAAAVGHAPDGWAQESGGYGIKLGGPALAKDKGRFRLDLPEGELWQGSQVILYGPQGELISGPVVPPADYPELEVQHDVSAVLLAPEQAMAGEIVRLEIKDDSLVGVGKWRLEGMPIITIGDSPKMQARIPLFLQVGQYAGITYEDDYGLEVISDDEAIEIVGGNPDDEEAPPSLTGCTPRVFRGRVACICGNFPSTEIQDGLAISGRPLGPPGAASSQVVYVTIPEDLTPGKHTITGAGIEGSIEITVLAARGEIDLSKILKGGSTPLRVIVEGTTEPLDLRLQNLAPDIIKLEGGDEQIVKTSGGALNVFERVVTGLAPGPFDVYYELAEDACPCVTSEIQIAQNDVGGTRTRDSQDSDTTRVRPPWWPPEEDDGDDPRDAPPPTIYGEEQDPENAPCCGFRGPLLVWPQTSDPLAQGDPMVAPHHPAVGGMQVHLATGAYFQNDRDLAVDAVGIPFDLTRHYVSDVETFSGGVIGHRWDFDYNKRLVALGRDYAEGLRGQMTGTEQSVVMLFDGTGRVLRYVEKDSEFRSVLNFGVRAAFRAYVTTYESPEGEFNELQRYVLEDPSAHPFAGHPDIDKGEAIFYVVREKNGVRYVYNCRGQLLHILARNDYASLPAGETHVPVRYTFFYQGPRSPLTQSNTLSAIEDPSGHRYGVTTLDIDKGFVNTNDDCIHITGELPIPRIKKIGGGGVEIEYVYKDEEKEPKPVLERIKRKFKGFDKPDLTVETEYHYDDEYRITSVVAPEEVAGQKRSYIENAYDDAGRVKSQKLAGAQYASISYTENGATVTSPAGSTTRYVLAPKGDYKLITQETVEGSGGSWTTSYAHNAATQITEITMPRGNKLIFEYDDANGEVTLGPMRNDFTGGVTYHNDLSKGNLIGQRRDVGSLPQGDGPRSIGTKTEYEQLYNQVTKLTDANGRETTFEYEYDRQGVLANPLVEKHPDITQPDGSVITVDPKKYEYTDRGQVETEASSLLDVTTYSYDDAGYITGISGPAGNQTFERELFGRALRWTGPEGAVKYELNVRGLVEKEIHDPYGFANETRYTYDLNGDITKAEVDVKDNFREGERLVAGVSAPKPVHADTSTIATEVDLIGRPVKETTTSKDLTFTTSRQYDAHGNVTRTEEPSPAGGTLVTTLEYDPRGLLVREQHAGFTTTYQYDANGNQTGMVVGEGAGARHYTFEIDPFDRQIASTSPVGTETRQTLDPNGNVLVEETRGPDGSQPAGTALLVKTERQYNEQDLLIALRKHVLDGSGSTSDTKYYYDQQAELRAAVAPGDAVTRLTYDAAGRVIEQTDPAGNKVKTEYDEFGRTTAVVEVEEENTYVVRSREWNTTTKEYRTTLTYDALGRVQTSSAPGANAAYRYNSRGEKRLDATEHFGVTDTQYDGLGRVSRVETGGRVETTTYTLSGQMAEMRAPHIHQRWKYDQQGLEIETVDVLTGAKTTTRRDPIGNPEFVTDPNGTIVKRTFNALGLAVREDIGLGDVVVELGGVRTPATVGPSNVWRRYDGLGRLRYAQNGNYAEYRNTGVAFEYDGLGRIVKEKQERDVDGQTIDHRYAPDNSWSEARYPEMTGKPVVRRQYDKLGRVVRVDLDGEMIASYKYDGVDRVAARSLRNGVLSLYTYDDVRRMTVATVWNETGPYYGTPAIIWSARATFDDHGRLATVFSADLNLASSSETHYTYDRLGRTTQSVTTTSSAGATPSQTVSRLLTTFDGDRPSFQAEVLIDTQGEHAQPLFARVQQFEYENDVVSAVTTTARNKFKGAPPEDLSTTAAVSEWIAGEGSFRDRQTYLYDALGNLIADDANVYAYDADRNLTRIAQVPGNRPYNQAIHFQYDPIGRRVRAYPSRDRTPVGFANFQPWTRQPIWFLYDGPDVIGEVVEATGSGSTLLARYFLGARPGERVRMDRRQDDDPAGAFVPYYFGAGLQGQITQLTDSDGAPHSTYSPTSNEAGSALAPPDELRFISGTKTRNPYLGWTTRIDGFAGTKFDEETGSAIYDYRTSTRLAEAMDMAAYRESITAMQNRGAVALAVVTMVAIAPGAAAFEGLLNVGLNWYAAARTQSGYTPGEAGEHFAIGALSGGLGKLVPGGSSLLSRYAADFATDFTGRMLFDVGWHGRPWRDVVADNIVGAAASASLSMGLRLGFAAVGAGIRRALVATLPKPDPSLLARGSTAGKAVVHSRKRRVTGEAFEGVLDGKFKSYAENGFEAEVLYLLLNGRSYHRFIGQLILKGKLTVHWDANLPQKTMGEWSKSSPTAIYLNPSAFRKHPSAALEAASTIVHEATHAMGGGEPAAHLAQGGFLHHWTSTKGRKGSTDMQHAGEYAMRPHLSRVMGVFVLSQMKGHPGPLYKMLSNIPSYGPKHQWFERLDEIMVNGRLHRQIFKKGGWGKVLHLDPGLDAAMARDVDAAKAWTY